MGILLMRRWRPRGTLDGTFVPMARHSGGNGKEPEELVATIESVLIPPTRNAKGGRKSFEKKRSIHVGLTRGIADNSPSAGWGLVRQLRWRARLFSRIVQRLP